MGTCSSRSKALAVAVSNDDLQTVVSIVRSKPEIVCAALDVYGNTAVLLAVRHGHFHLVPLLNRAGFSLDCRNRLGQTALGQLLKRIITSGTTTISNIGNIDIADEGHLTKSIVVDENDNNLEYYIRAGVYRQTEVRCDNKRTVDKWKTSSDTINSGDEHSRLQTHLANRDVELGVSCIQYFLDRLNPIETRRIADQKFNSNGDTALILAVRHRRYSIVPLLIQAGCDVNSINHDGHSALDVLIYSLFPVHPGKDKVYLRPEPEIGVVDDWSFKRLPEVFRLLLIAGCCGRALGWFILHTLQQSDLVKDLCVYCSDLGKTSEGVLLSKLLLQTAVKFMQQENVTILLRRGVDLRAFWYRPAFSRCGLDEDTHVTWDLAVSVASKGAMGKLCSRILDGLLTPAVSIITLILSAVSERILSKIVTEALRNSNPWDTFETGRAIEVFYPYNILWRQVPGQNILRSLALAGTKLDRKTIDELAARYNIDSKSYRRCLETPRRLMSLCRTCVRLHLQRNVCYGVERLPLPASLKCYVLEIDS